MGCVWRLGILAMPIMAVACVGTIGDGLGDEDGEGTPGTTSGEFVCDESAVPSASPMRRLSYAQYENTLRDLLAETQTQADADVIFAGLDASLSLVPRDSDADFRRLDQAGTQAHLDGYYQTALAIAREVVSSTARLERLAGACATDADTSNDAACVRSFTESFGSLALRRPLVEDEIDFYSGDANADVTSTLPESFSERITVLLLAPQFLYHLEDQLPAGEDPDAFPLSGFEIAARLSYHFWDSMPDAELRAAAADGTLETEEGYAAQVDRLFGHARTHAVADKFFGEWLDLDHLPAMDAAVGSPAYDAYVGNDVPGPDLTEHMTEEVRDLLRHYTWTEPGGIDAVLQSNLSFAKTADLAGIYGVPVWTEGQAPPELPEGERAGLLTRAAMVATGTTVTRPVHKGVTIRERILCDDIPPPPPDVGELPQLSDDMTVRERLEELTMQEGSSCLGCHGSFNALGFATENYDGLGRFRTMERIFDDAGNLVAEKPVNAEATPEVKPSDDRVAENGVDLSQYVAESGKVESCLSRQYFRFAYGRLEDLERDGCALVSFRLALEEGGSLAGMLREVAMQPTFKVRIRAQEAE